MRAIADCVVGRRQGQAERLLRDRDAIQGVVTHGVRAGVVGRGQHVVVAIVTEGERVQRTAGDDPVLAGLAVVVVVAVIDAPAAIFSRKSSRTGRGQPYCQGDNPASHRFDNPTWNDGEHRQHQVIRDAFRDWTQPREGGSCEVRRNNRAGHTYVSEVSGIKRCNTEPRFLLGTYSAVSTL